MRIKKKNNLILDQKLISEIANNLNLPPKFVELLLERGLDNEQKINRFLYCEKNNFHDPFAFSDMQKVVDRIKQAKDNNEKVVIYSDYDADGICAAAILALFLASIDIDVYTHIPNRGVEGYGLSFESIDRIIEELCPDLIITTDCGISNIAEVEHVFDLGVDIIVTDHHEVADEVPNCLILNPHLPNCGYPFEYLCGAGVAFKLVQAFIGEDAAEYLDMAAIATVADLVPLKGENRLIVQLGLKQIQKRTNKGIAKMLDTLNITQVSSMDIAFKIAPRINAAGRMGDAARAFYLLISSDVDKINAIVEEIEQENNLRKKLCESMYKEALGDLAEEKLFEKRSIVLSHPSWEKGITGIVAARLAGEFRRPSFVLVKAGDVYKGTARSIEGINIYELLTFVSDLLAEFGGHSQAAGFSIKEGNIEEFKNRVEQYLQRFNNELFMPSFYYDIDVTKEQMTTQFVNALELLQPFGNSNPRPLFRLNTPIKSVNPCRSSNAHSQIVTSDKLNLIAFNFSNKNQILLGSDNKDLIIEAQIGHYNEVRGILRHAYSKSLYINDNLAQSNFIKTLGIKNSMVYNNEIKYNKEELFKIIDDNIYGNLIIAGSEKSYTSFISSQSGNKAVLREFIYSTDKNNYTRIIISPEYDDNLLLRLYKNIIFLDTPLNNDLTSFIYEASNAQIFVPETDNRAQFLQGIDLSRETFASYFNAIRMFSGVGSSIYSYFFNLNRVIPLKLRQFIVCTLIFKELGFIQEKWNKGFSFAINKGVQAKLSSSLIYQQVAQILNK